MRRDDDARRGGPTTVAVLGLGLIGGSLARRLARQGVTVTGYDSSVETRALAADAGIWVVEDVESLCASAPDVLVLAVPLRAMRPVAGEVARHLPATTVVTDVGSVKGPVREVLEGCGLGDRYVGAHPMAGTEESGFAASSAGLLDAARWAVTVTDRTRPERLATVLALVTGAAGGRAFVLTDDVHDEAAALISHVPHAFAIELLNLVSAAPVRGVALALAAGSFRDGTRVGRTDPRRTEAMLTENAGWVAPALRLAARDLEALATALEENAATTGFFDRADDVRATWQPQGAAAVAPVPDGSRGGVGAAGTERLSVDLGGPEWFTELVELSVAGWAVVAVHGDMVELAREGDGGSGRPSR
ncbi:prephenate dehydrogenase/arogenate dehydrogenase family protein [Oerskovia turbata]|uniref:Prephenate dehydrogenase/arogenate dehydrogenase family protein n=1 Tax=Oerskovia turbata TaxID=1713 RepID=A0A4V1N5T5_9CELL|nr:prephenate dehydrogenase/arogenate dehydrogenase family protein [Oerskovia turbata]RXR26313.1 prephenate dehydrogenase/arogenate dehydrogenase family protein [Oerskovia turbata]RXR36815.1 prephenate dehydrogenase/arogenate dehydrogenase family protein [Oerskovia turbata]TGJ98097.1 prephenate dehydrogenase/arogenate dehydrogenase family protein [Actinotalea fermentans ATCC 43279 = JCM 9966 = DSM 3133]